MKADVEKLEVELMEVHLKQTAYEQRIARLVRALLEIDELLNPQHDEPLSEKEAA